MVVDGTEGEQILGKNPIHDTAFFTKFQHSHLGQCGIPLFDGFELLLMPPCGLLIILAHHRYSWSALLAPIIRRNETDMIFETFKSIGCGYLSMQMETYYNNNKIFMTEAIN